MNKLVKNTSIYALGDIIPRLLSFISLPILTSYLTPAEYGIINYINTINLFLLVLGLMCLNTYYLVYYYRVGNEEEKKKLLGNLTIFVIGVNIILTTVLLFQGELLFKMIGSNIDFYPYVVIGIITNFFNLFPILPSALYRLEERPLPLTLLNIIKGILAFALTLILVVFFDFKALGVLYSNMIIAVFFGVIFFYITVKNMIWNVNWTQIRKALHFSLPLLPGSISYYLVSMSDRLLIDKYLNLSDLGIYGAAVSLAMILNILSNGAYKAFEPHFFKIYGTTLFLPHFCRIRDDYFFAILTSALAIAFFCKEFFIIFTEPEFHIAFYYVPLILIGVVFTSMSLLYSTIIKAREKTKISSVITVGGGILSMCLNILLLPLIGLLAACITSIITFGLMLIASIYFSKVRISHFRTITALLLSFIIAYVAIYVLNVEHLILSILCKFVIFISLIFLVSNILNIDLRNLLNIKKT